jgi:hypothetical protein
VFIANVNDLRNILENIGQLVESLHNAMDVNMYVKNCESRDESFLVSIREK